MLESLSTIPTPTLRRESRRLELRIIDGCAGDRDIDLFFSVATELGRRIAVRSAFPGSLDAVVDPRD